MLSGKQYMDRLLPHDARYERGAVLAVMHVLYLGVRLFYSKYLHEVTEDSHSRSLATTQATSACTMYG